MRFILRIFPVLFLILFFCCCENEKKEINTDDLFGTWQVVSHTVDSKSYSDYTLLWKWTDATTNIVFKIDTIRFGETYFEFAQWNHPLLFHGLTIRSANVRALKGYFYFDNSHDIILNSDQSEYMDQDTLINDWRRQFSKFIQPQFKIDALDEAHLRLTTDNQILELERM